MGKPYFITTRTVIFSGVSTPEDPSYLVTSRGPSTRVAPWRFSVTIEIMSARVRKSFRGQVGILILFGVGLHTQDHRNRIIGNGPDQAAVQRDTVSHRDGYGVFEIGFESPG